MGVKKFSQISILVFFVLLICSFGSFGCIAGVISGSGKILTKTYEFIDFNGIAVGHAFKFEITRSDTYSISITADDNLFQFVSINKIADTLIIDLDPTYTYINTTQTGKITLPALISLSLSGASQANVSGFSSTNPATFNLGGAATANLVGFKSGDAKFDVSGAGRVSGDVEAGKARFTVSGGGNVALEGKASSASIDASGGSQLSLSDFLVNTATVVLSGGSVAKVNVSAKLDVDISGGSRLDYSGNPSLGNVSVSGGATLNHK